MSRTIFSVQVGIEKRWQLEAEFASEAEAMKMAESLVNANQHDAVRIIREWQRADGGISEREIFNKVLTGQKKKITVNAIDQANECSVADDLYGLESRLTIGRLLRRLFDDMVLTPSEFLHYYPLAKKFLDGDLYPVAIDRVASLQAAAAGVDSRTRRDQLYAMVDVLAVQAREAEAEKALWKIKLEDLDVLAQAATAAGGEAKRDFLIRTAISRELVNVRSWIGKVERLVGLIADDTPADRIAIMDGFIADVLAAPEAVQELLGNHHNLAAALKAMLALVYGAKTPPKNQLPQTAVVLAGLFAKEMLPSGRVVVTDRVRRQIQSPAVLSRNEPGQEDELFNQLFDALLTDDGIIGGPPMADALVTRYARRFDAGATDSTRSAIMALGDLVLERSKRCRFLMMVAEAPSGRPFAREIGEVILNMATKAPDIHNFVHYRQTPLRKLTTVTDLMRRGLASTAIPADVVQSMVTRFDDLLVLYIDREQLVEKLDDPTHPFKNRAMRLVKFCGSGVLIEGKALTVMRDRVIDLLRRPRFVEDFTKGIADPAEADRSVREFRALLVESGFHAFAQ